ncbi:acyl-coenzyme A thioesterase 8-like [Hibiscus syriacus]|uniref:Acyl-coenzyme A thioesterase 8-like n=1 Tax=Hibiscus syriacus TaxID=106335 RepID=A0A6A3AAP6_HIBSY|nr:acyl-coenzyme A thioesterase 8-like [Hibiscus syriacus]
MRELPSRSLLRKGIGFEVLGKKLYLMGGCRWTEDATVETYCYDASNNSWSEANPLSTARILYPTSPLDNFKVILGVFVSDATSLVKLSIRKYIQLISHVYPVVYEPSSGTWQHADADMVLGWQGHAVVVGKILYVLDESSGTRLMMWDKDLREWVAIGRLFPLLTRPPCKLVAVGNSIYVIGKGRSTVVVDVSNAGNGVGMMVSSSIPKLTSNDEIISCKCLAI